MANKIAMRASMKEERDNKTNRILAIFDRLNKGEAVNKKHLSQEMLVNEKTIQRDIDDIRAFYSERYETFGRVELRYDAKKKGYCLISSADSYLKNNEILAISKVLLDSRAFNKAEFNSLIDKLIMQASPADRKIIKDIIANERFHYVCLQHNVALLENLWQLSSAIRQRKFIKLYL
jgi:predicted DNA-binding transcriptional regulator YafY